jgi:hypothetical protein
LKREFGLKAGKNAIGRILKERGLTRRKRKKRERQRDLREVKAQYRALTHLQMDVKYLTDIPYYWPQMEALGLPRFEYTIRDTKSGALFLGFGHELSVTYASLLIRRCLMHLERCGIEPSSVTVQTDRGSEFSGGQRGSGTSASCTPWRGCAAHGRCSRRRGGRTRTRTWRRCTGSSRTPADQNESTASPGETRRRF